MRISDWSSDVCSSDLADAPDFGSALPLLGAHRNLVVTRTFSKAYALAGLRVSYAVAHPDVAELLERVRESFNVNAVALAAAEGARGDGRSEEHTSELQSLMRISYAVFCLKKKKR